jgi:multiple sugar transport system substrate-binding protein
MQANNIDRLKLATGLLLLVLLIVLTATRPRASVPAGREEVVFWHFWGGHDRRVVEEIVNRFNQSQDRHFVRAVAMPGNNLDMKMFLAVTGGDPPDLINQDDPIVADWAHRGALLPLDEIASPAEIEQLNGWLLPAARQLGSYQQRLYGLANGLDIRALYYNRTLIEQRSGQPAPRQLASIEQLDRLAEACVVEDPDGQPTALGFLPDPRRLWAWGVVFGGAFYDADTKRVTAADPANVEALQWMASYRHRFGPDNLAAFRQGDQSLPGKTFPLLAGRYAIVLDGQWRVRDIRAARQQQLEQGQPPTEYGVWQLPAPRGRQAAAEGWVNGNLFLVPRGCRNAAGSWEFMKFWSGFGGHEAEAARIASQGGWIPVSQQVMDHPLFVQYLEENPLFAEFVRLAAGRQVPTPVIPGARLYYRQLNQAAGRLLYSKQELSARELLEQTTRAVQQHLQRLERHDAGSAGGGS